MFPFSKFLSRAALLALNSLFIFAFLPSLVKFVARVMAYFPAYVKNGIILEDK
ncbi:MAG TPA: hypothetical protein [Caudoviricetes sp.]|nr:MAG TPA: hypothetical protein [Caudoviricetes sp.]